MIKKQTFLLIIFHLLTIYKAISQDQKINVGAYYFDGWTGTYPYHITPALVKSFPEREPKWGWITSKQSIIDEQIDLASDAGLSFFSFCWYYDGKDTFKTLPLNNALGFYLKSPNVSKLKFCLLVANHKGFEIGPDDWLTVSAEWIKYFSQSSHLTVDGKPLIIFFTIDTLTKNFGGTKPVREAFEKLRSDAVKAGLKGATIGICVGDNKDAIKTAELCGFDVITGYNYHSAGLKQIQKVPIDSMIVAETRTWSKIQSYSSLKYIPVSTLAWDPRPWATAANNFNNLPYYTGFSSNSVFKSTRNCIAWLNKNKNTTTRELVAILYAWNENGEGPYLTPSKNGENMLDGVKRALLNQKPSTVGP